MLKLWAFASIIGWSVSLYRFAVANPLTALGIAVALYIWYRIFRSGVVGSMRAKSRTRRRIRDYRAAHPLPRYKGSDDALLARLKIDRSKGKEIARDYLEWSSYPEFHRPHLRQFPGVELEYDDRKRLAQIFYGK